MKLVKILFSLHMFVFITGCATMSVNTDYDPLYDFASIKTYEWMPFPENIQENELAIKHIQYAVNSNLQTKGFAQSPKNPDILVAVHGGKERRVDVQEWGYGYSNRDYYHAGPYRRDPYLRHPGPYMDDARADFGYTRGVDRYEYDVGTLVIDIIDAQAKELIWRGTATGVIDPKAPSREVITRSVNKILEAFPPAP